MNRVGQAVLFVNLSRRWGGGEQWHLTMARELGRRGWAAGLLAYPRSPLVAAAAAAGVHCRALALRSASLLLPWKVAALRRLLAEERPRALILNGAHELMTAGVLGQLAGVPRIILRRGIPKPLRRNWLNRLLLARVATGLIGPSKAVVAAMAQAFPEAAPRLRPTVIYSGADPDSWQPVERREPKGRIAVVARLEAEKGVDLSLRALLLVRERVPGATLRVVGDGAERRNLKRLAEELGLSNAVEFVGATPDVATALGGCDVFLGPSRWEGFSMAAVEAMLMALPVVAFDLPAYREAVEEGMSGLLAPPGDLKALADALAGLLEDAERARAMGAAGRRRALERFTLDRAAADLERLLAGSPDIGETLP